MKKKSEPLTMSLTEHLRELRNRLLICLLFLALAMLIGLRLAPTIVERLLSLGVRYHYRFIYTAPQELLLQYISIALICSLCLALPILLYQTIAFISPGLHPHENRIFRFALGAGSLCFSVGVLFALRVMLPFMLQFLISLSGQTTATPSITVQNYLSFLMTVFVAFGLMFELPVVAVLLTQTGLLKVRWMRKARRVVIVIIFLVAALITPPDVVSQIMVAVPMLILYEISIIICTILERAHKSSDD